MLPFLLQIGCVSSTILSLGPVEGYADPIAEQTVQTLVANHGRVLFNKHKIPSATGRRANNVVNDQRDLPFALVDSTRVCAAYSCSSGGSQASKSTLLKPWDSPAVLSFARAGFCVHVVECVLFRFTPIKLTGHCWQEGCLTWV